MVPVTGLDKKLRRKQVWLKNENVLDGEVSDAYEGLRWNI